MVYFETPFYAQDIFEQCMSNIGVKKGAAVA